MSTHTAMRATAPTLVTTITQPDNRPDILVRTVKGTVTILGVNGQPDVSIRTAGRRAKLPVLRKDGTIGLRRPRTDEERERVSLLQKVRAIIAIAAQVGTQRAAVTFVADPGLWPYLRLLTQEYLPDGFRSAGTKRPTRHNLCDFNRKWASTQWADIRDRYGKAVTGYAMTGAKKLGYFNPDQHLLYNDIDPKQWVTADGTVCQSPSSKTRAETDARTDPASGHHAHAGRDKYGSKFVLIETVSDDYRGQIILDVEHVAPKPGDQRGDEGATTITMLDRLKGRAPGIRGASIDSVFRGNHLRHLYNIGIVTVNHRLAKENPNRAEGGRNADGRVERTQKLRTVTHARRNGQPCIHNLHVVGSIPHQETIDAEGNTVLTPLPAPRTHRQRTNGDGTQRWYLSLVVPCRHGDTDVLIRLDDHGENDITGWSRADLLRFYPTNTTQFGVIYGYRNRTESAHSQMKRGMPKIPAYGVTRQTLYMFGYLIGHNAVAFALHRQRDGLPNALDGTG